MPSENLLKIMDSMIPKSKLSTNIRETGVRHNVNQRNPTDTTSSDYEMEQLHKQFVNFFNESRKLNGYSTSKLVNNFYPNIENQVVSSEIEHISKSKEFTSQ